MDEAEREALAHRRDIRRDMELLHAAMVARQGTLDQAAEKVKVRLDALIAIHDSGPLTWEEVVARIDSLGDQIQFTETLTTEFELLTRVANLLGAFAEMFPAEDDQAKPN